MINNKGFTIIEIIAGLIIAGIIFLILIGVVDRDGMTRKQEMEYCMDEYEDFDYCKYKLGVDYE